MGLFGDHERVSREEFKRALWKLHDKGFSQEEVSEVESTFRGDLHENGASAGISKEEIKKGISWLKDHHGGLSLSSEHISKVEEVLKHYL